MYIHSIIHVIYFVYPSLHQSIFCFDSSQSKLLTSVYFTINTLACVPLVKSFLRNPKKCSQNICFLEGVA